VKTNEPSIAFVRSQEALSEAKRSKREFIMKIDAPSLNVAVYALASAA